MTPFKEIDAKKLAKDLGVDYAELQTKHKLIDKIIEARNNQLLSQEDLAEMIGCSQAYISKIETKTKTRNVSIDQLLRILFKLGYECEVNVRKRSRVSRLQGVR